MVDVVVVVDVMVAVDGAVVVDDVALAPVVLLDGLKQGIWRRGTWRARPKWGTGSARRKAYATLKTAILV